ncbi:hypothetical protein L195_g020592 [Trifolium pratense]|uniref:Reverse transcriptase zinc-binding domain-containing protein n=1 Tax=Trifolium pratense TaxID=57577 RepID=A0A2K3N2Y5_TRIPR|nr:hypothetical protein L195_g020592 [Trifolium pratense]
MKEANQWLVKMKFRGAVIRKFHKAACGGVIQDSTVAWIGGSESAEHLFASCSQISHDWYGILRLLGVELMPPRGILELFEGFLAWVRVGNIVWSGC